MSLRILSVHLLPMCGHAYLFALRSTCVLPKHNQTQELTQPFLMQVLLPHTRAK